MMSSTWRARSLISITDMPLPCQSSNSSRMRSSTGSGSAPGPALKLCTLFTPRPATVEVPTIADSSLGIDLNRIAEFGAASANGKTRTLLPEQSNNLCPAAERPIFFNSSFDGRKLWRNDLLVSLQIFQPRKIYVPLPDHH